MERHVKNIHGEKECPVCNKIFNNKNVLIDHIENCLNITKNPRYICNKCKMICEGKDDLNKHINNGHCDVDTNTSRNVVCRFYRQGHCRFGNMCKFAHVGYSNIHQNPPNYFNNSNRKEPCRNGNNCRWNKNNTCRFFLDTIRFSSQINTPLFNTQNESQGRCW